MVNHGFMTMVNHGQSMVRLTMLDLMLLKNGIIVDHGQTMAILTMLLKNGTMVDHGQAMVDRALRNGTTVNHG